MEVAIRETHGHMLRFVITTVTDTKPSAGRLYTASPGQTNHGGVAWYMKSGLNCFAPKGQATLVLATPAVKDFAARHPDGTTHYRVPSLENPGGLLARLRARAGR
ncbi:MAG: hypothetical protein E7K72_26490 [Roseomonas mucosa]|nr:hypothetical protein [Roseomonas mucosa]